MLRAFAATTSTEFVADAEIGDDLEAGQPVHQGGIDVAAGDAADARPDFGEEPVAVGGLEQPVKGKGVLQRGEAIAVEALGDKDFDGNGSSPGDVQAVRRPSYPRWPHLSTSPRPASPDRHCDDAPQCL